MHRSVNNPVDIIIKDVLSEKLGIDFQLIQSETSLRDDLCIDSLDFVEIILEIEKKFKIRISDEESEKFRTVDHITQFIKQKFS